MKEPFYCRGYNVNQIQAVGQKIEGWSRLELLKKKETCQKRFSAVFSAIYTKCGEQIKCIINWHWCILQTDDRLKSLQDPPLTVFKCGRNLRDYWVKSYLSPQSVTTQSTLTPISEGNYHCGTCSQCSYTYWCASFKHPHTGKSIPVKGIIQ